MRRTALVGLAAVLLASAAARADDEPQIAMPEPEGPPPPAALGAPATGQQGTLVIAEDGQALEFACAGRNVLVTGSRDRLVLRGGCRSVTVQGRADTIRAELLPGARIAIGGEAVTLHYRMVAAGALPILSIAGSGSEAILEGASDSR
jgi:hypothetical protein